MRHSDWVESTQKQMLPAFFLHCNNFFCLFSLFFSVLLKPSHLNFLGRGERVRTSGLYVPNVALFLAELRPDKENCLRQKQKRRFVAPFSLRHLPRVDCLDSDRSDSRARSQPLPGGQRKHWQQRGGEAEHEKLQKGLQHD
jgi:hypothetical protein